MKQHSIPQWVLIGAPLIVSMIFLAQCAVVGAPTKRVMSAYPMEHGGLTRTYWVQHPTPSLATHLGKRPLFLFLHGGGGIGQHFESLTKGRLTQLANQYGAILVFPEAYKRHWNDGRNGYNIESHRKNIDDVGFLSKVIEALVAQHGADPNRVFVAGISNGGMMAARLACERTDLVNGIGMVGANMPRDLVPTCKPSRPVSVLLFNGTMDPLVPFSGGGIGFNERKPSGFVISANDTAEFWARIVDPQAKAYPDVTYDAVRGDQTAVYRQVYAETPAHQVVMYVIQNGGHTWPNGKQYLPAAWIGKTSREIDASEVMFKTFLK